MKREPSSPETAARTASAPTNPLDWPHVAGRAGAVVGAIEDFVRRRRRRRVTAITAGFAGLVLIAAAGWSGGWGRRAAMTADATASAVVAMPLRQTLPDGSVVELRTGAEIAVEFTEASAGPRRVVLRRGDAHFSVAKNPQRPFVVAVGGVEVRAVGTAFAVQWGGAEVEVLVTEGRVAVDGPVVDPQPNLVSAEAPRVVAPPPLAFVDAGSRAVVATDRVALEAQVETISAAELGERLAWRVPRLEFNATPLGEVVAMINRHAVSVAPANGPASRLVLDEPELRVLPLSGTLRADNLAVLLQILETSYGIAAERRAGGEIVLRKAR